MKPFILISIVLVLCFLGQERVSYAQEGPTNGGGGSLGTTSTPTNGTDKPPTIPDVGETPSTGRMSQLLWGIVALLVVLIIITAIVLVYKKYKDRSDDRASDERNRIIQQQARVHAHSISRAEVVPHNSSQPLNNLNSLGGNRCILDDGQFRSLQNAIVTSGNTVSSHLGNLKDEMARIIRQELGREIGKIQQAGTEMSRQNERLKSEVDTTREKLRECESEKARVDAENHSLESNFKRELQAKDANLAQAHAEIEAVKSCIERQREEHEDALSVAKRTIQETVDHYWPKMILDGPIGDLRPLIDSAIQSGNASSAVYQFFGAIQQWAAFRDTPESANTCEELGKAFYAWAEGVGRHDVAVQYAEPIAKWLTEGLEPLRLTVQSVADGSNFNDRVHSRVGTGIVIKSASSFLILNDKGTAYKKALVQT